MPSGFFPLVRGQPLPAYCIIIYQDVWKKTIFREKLLFDSQEISNPSDTLDNASVVWITVEMMECSYAVGIFGLVVLAYGETT